MTNRNPDINYSKFENIVLPKFENIVLPKFENIDLPKMNLDYEKSPFSNGYYGYEVTTSANLRAQMSRTSAILTTIPKGEIVEVINSQIGDWWEVYYDGIRGYVHSSLLSSLSETFSSSNYNNLDTITYAIDNYNLYSSYTTYYTKVTANLREEMSTNSAIIMKIPQGKSVKVINTLFSDWWEIYCDGKTGYIASSLLWK